MNTQFLNTILAIFIFSALPALGVSDTDVFIVSAESVDIDDNKITIVAEATTTMTIITADHDPTYKGAAQWGRPAERVQAKSDNAKFVILRPEGNDAAWEIALEAARGLKAGKEVGRIGFYRPTVVFKLNQIVSIEGAGYLYQKHPEKTEPAK